MSDARRSAALKMAPLVPLLTPVMLKRRPSVQKLAWLNTEARSSEWISRARRGTASTTTSLQASAAIAAYGVGFLWLDRVFPGCRRRRLPFWTPGALAPPGLRRPPRDVPHAHRETVGVDELTRRPTRAGPKAIAR